MLQNVPTYRCREPDALKFVLERLDQLVVKEVNGSGGYGMLVGPHATVAQRELFAGKLKADPANYIAQPTLALSTCPASFESGVSPRHVDLRPFVLTGADGVRIVPGGLTRVALTQGLAGGQFEPGRRHQGHLGGRRRSWRGGLTPCSPAPPTTCSGSPARWSAPTSSPA